MLLTRVSANMRAQFRFSSNYAQNPNAWGDRYYVRYLQHSFYFANLMTRLHEQMGSLPVYRIEISNFASNHTKPASLRTTQALQDTTVRVISSASESRCIQKREAVCRNLIFWTECLAYFAELCWNFTKNAKLWGTALKRQIMRRIIACLSTPYKFDKSISLFLSDSVKRARYLVASCQSEKKNKQNKQGC